MYFHTMITLQNFKNNTPCEALVSKSASMLYVLQYAIDILFLSTQYFTNK